MMKQPRIFYLLQQAHSALFRASDKMLKKKLGLSTTQQTILFLLMRNDGVPISSIAETLKMGKSSLTGLIDRMEERGFVRRAPSSQDGRSLEVFIEPEGRELAQTSLAGVKRTNAALLDPFSTEEQAVIQRFLMHISENAERIVTNPDSPLPKERKPDE